MKKKLLALFIMVVMVLAAVVGLVACDPQEEKPANKTAITVWTSEVKGVKTKTDEQIAAFLDANPDYKDKYTVTVDGIGEGEAATQMLKDVATGADIFCFAQDQLGRLVEGNALSELGNAAKQTVSKDNDTSSIAAVTLGDKMYAYPLTSDNGYFLYYNTEVLSADDVKDLATMVSVAKEAGQKISFQLGGSAWFMASFFFGAGCQSSWTYDDDAKLWKANDDFNSDNGIIAMKGMHILTGESDVWMDSANASDLGAATPSCAVVSGTWDSGTAKEMLGDKLGVAKLPSYNVDGTDYQLGSYSGNKLIGVKPHTEPADQKFCHDLAQYLSNKACQLDRFDEFGWGPSNKEAKAEERVSNDAILKALGEQNNYAVPEGQICGGWWDFAKLLGTASAGEASTYQAALDEYTAAINKYETMTEEEMNAFGIVGEIASDPTVTWSSDNKMIKQEGATETSVTWISEATYVLAAGDNFQCRQGKAWNVQYGAIGEDGYSTKGNFVITAENAGTYKIKLVVTLEGGKPVSGVVSLVPAE